MTTQIQHRWGILALAVLMFFVTLIVTQINGAKTSLYYFVWIMVGYYAYKARLSDIQIMMKVLIYLNITVLALVIIFADGNDSGYLAKDWKINLIFGVLVMLVPKILLFFYCKKQLENSGDDSHSSIGESVKAPKQERPNVVPFTITSEKKVALSPMHTNNSEPKTTITPVTSSEEGYWALAMSELEGVQRRPGLWAKAFAEAQGNEDAAKANYLKWRVVQLKDEEEKRIQKIEEAQLAERAKIYGECPSCSREIFWSEAKCPHCRASFGLGSPYRILPLQKK